jgi:hypothetical protein
MVELFCADKLSPVTFGFELAYQLNDVFGIVAVKGKFTEEPDVTLTELGLVIDSMGCTQTETVWVGPTQPFAVGVTE